MTHTSTEQPEALPELLPCPFCDCELIDVDSWHEGSRDTLLWGIYAASAKCHGCGSLIERGKDSEEKALAAVYEAWNRRAPVVPQRCDLCKNNGGYFYGRTGYETCCADASEPVQLHEFLRKLRISAKRDGELGRDSSRTDEIEQKVLQLLANHA